MKTIYIPPLQKEWEERKRLLEEGAKLREEGDKLREEGNKLWKEGNKLRKEGWKLCKEERKLWDDAVEKYYGKDAKVKWRKWHENNEPTCHVGSDVYI